MSSDKSRSSVPIAEQTAKQNCRQPLSDAASTFGNAAQAVIERGDCRCTRAGKFSGESVLFTRTLSSLSIAWQSPQAILRMLGKTF